MEYLYITSLVTKSACRTNPFGSLPIKEGQLGKVQSEEHGMYTIAYVGNCGRDYVWLSESEFRKATDDEIMALNSSEDRILHGLLTPMWRPAHWDYPNGLP